MLDSVLVSFVSVVTGSVVTSNKGRINNLLKYSMHSNMYRCIVNSSSSSKTQELEVGMTRRALLDIPTSSPWNELNVTLFRLHGMDRRS